MKAANDSQTANDEPIAGTRPAPKGWFHRFVGWFLNRLYTDWARAYDLVASVTSMGQWWAWQRAVEDVLPEGRLLEVGFGTGKVLHRLTRQAREVIGVDVSGQMVEISKARLRDDTLPVRLARADALALPLPNRTFAAAYATFPSEFILKMGVVREVLRVLRAGGTFIIIPMVRIRGDGTLDRFAGWLYRITGQSGPLPEDWDAPFRRLDVNVRLETVEQARAEVLRLVITKPQDQADRIRSQPESS